MTAMGRMGRMNSTALTAPCLLSCGVCVELTGMQMSTRVDDVLSAFDGMPVLSTKLSLQRQGWGANSRAPVGKPVC